MLLELSVAVARPEPTADRRADCAAQKRVVVRRAVALEHDSSQDAGRGPNAGTDQRPVRRGTAIAAFQSRTDFNAVDRGRRERPDLRPDAFLDDHYGVSTQPLIAADDGRNDLRRLHTNSGTRCERLRGSHRAGHEDEKRREERAVRVTSAWHDVF